MDWATSTLRGVHAINERSNRFGWITTEQSKQAYVTMLDSLLRLNRVRRCEPFISGCRDADEGWKLLSTQLAQFRYIAEPVEGEETERMTSRRHVMRRISGKYDEFGRKCLKDDIGMAAIICGTVAHRVFTDNIPGMSIAQLR